MSCFSSHLPKQIQRLLAFYAVLVFLVVFFWKSKTFKSSSSIFNVINLITGSQTRLDSVNTAVFPRKIWQIWRVNPLHFEERDSLRAKSWSELNPGYRCVIRVKNRHFPNIVRRYEVLTDDNDMYYVEMNFGPAGLDRPDIVYCYRSLTARIIKADLLRYLVLYLEGGVYADIDVEALQPIKDFVPSHFNKADLDLVIGIEVDEPSFANHAILGPKSQSFCQWTIMSKPRNPAILRMINNVIKWLAETAKAQDVEISEITLNFDNVLSGTGPSAFTAAILAEMRVQANRAIEWNMFHNMSEPKLVGRILVLTVKEFAAGQGHSNSGDRDSKAALVRHYYHASLWPSRHPRYSHPIYGIVEDCNWNRTCVDTWTANTDAFPSLPEEEKTRLIEAHKIVIEEKLRKEEEEKKVAELTRLDREREELLAKCAAVTNTLEEAQTATSPEAQSPVP
jgi:mannosyltransferase OCH1-like enzyme